MPPVTTSEYETLKRSIKEEGGLLVPVVLNQDNVVLDGHHRLQTCGELDIPASFLKKDFIGRPLDEMMYVNIYQVSTTFSVQRITKFSASVVNMGEFLWEDMMIY
jgi:hypothetical protein